jgi:hypothetical protein
MHAQDDEAALTQLSTAFVYLALVRRYRPLPLPPLCAHVAASPPPCRQGGDKYKEASLILKDLYDRHGASAVTLNALAATYIAMRRFDDAEKVVEVRHSNDQLARIFGGGLPSLACTISVPSRLPPQEALARDPGDADALVNMIAISVHTGRSGDVAAKLLPQLREAAPGHAYVKQLDTAERMFDRVAAGYGV